MDLKMKGSDVRKYHRYQNQSMMTLANSNHAEPTKKAIEAEDPAFHPLPSANHRKYLFALPFST